MASIEEILAGLCRSVESSPNNGLRKVYVLKNAAEAKLAFELLLAHGFDVKFYDDADGGKLYYTPSPSKNPAREQQKLAQAASHAAAMSAIKRDRGIKDWGHLIAGHGGFLDRLDSVIFAAPIFFHVTRWVWSTT